MKTKEVVVLVRGGRFREAVAGVMAMRAKVFWADEGWGLTAPRRTEAVGW